MKKALIFGITGQDGSYLAELLVEKGYHVTGVARRVSVCTLSRIEHILPQLNIVEGDIMDSFNVRQIIEEVEPDEVYNLAAQSHVATSFKQVLLTTEVTYLGACNILDAIRYDSRRDKIKFYQASSSEMFGKNYSREKHATLKIGIDGEVVVDSPTGKGIYDYKKYQDEDTAMLPQSPYAVAKHAAHNMVRIYRDSYNMFACSGILFNHESERRGENFVTRKITKWIGEFHKFRSKGSIPIGLDEKERKRLEENPDLLYREFEGRIISFPKLRLGNLDAKRDWGHAEDYVEAMWLMLQQDEPDDYVVATGETYTVRQFLDAAFARIGIDDWERFVIIDPEFYRPAEVDYLLGMPKKAEEKLGWKRKVSFQELANRMVDHDIQLARLKNEKRKCCGSKRSCE